MKTILVTGSDGLVGSAIKAKSIEMPYKFIFCNREHGDLTKESHVACLFDTFRPHYVIHTAAKVGGVGGNASHHGEYFYQNILMNAHLIHYAYQYNVEKFLAFSSVCVFPCEMSVVNEEMLQQGEPFSGNFAYGYAKRMVDVQISAYKKQYGIKNYTSIIPGNIFGRHDYYNLESGHVISSLIHKVYLAKQNKTPLKVWGNGTAKREFIYSNDLARFILKIIDLEVIPQRVIISSDRQYSIKEMVEKLCKVAGFDGDVIWEIDKPNGQKSRSTDLMLLKSIVGELEYTDLEIALKDSYDWFVNTYPKVRK